MNNHATKSLCILLAAVLLLIPLAACSPSYVDLTEDVKKNPITIDTGRVTDPSAPVTDPPVTPVSLRPAGADGVADFYVRLFKESAVAGENTLISPLSVLYALAMTANGAKGNTLAQMEAVLGMPVDELNRYLHAYLEALPDEDDYDLEIANSLWIKDDGKFTVQRPFLQTAVDYYDAEVFQAPFDAGTKRDINRWVEDETDGMIQNILDEIPADAVLYLINALCFDALWDEEYTTADIGKNTFTGEDGTERTTEFLYSTEGLFLENDCATGVLKPYKDGKYAFVALLPKAGVSVSQYVASLTGETLLATLQNATSVPVHTAIPSFKTESTVQMADILAGMGMPDAFDANVADLSAMGSHPDGRLAISRVIHKTFLQLDAKGTRAGAATVVEIMCESAAPVEETKTVFLNRPFVYLLIDTETSLPLFMGTMLDVDR